MKVADIIRSLTDMGIELVILGDEILVRRAGSAPLDREGVKPFLKALRQQKTAAIAYLRKMQNRTQDLPSCNSCPWYMDNPWTHYPDLQGWCGHWWDFLLGPHNPQCRDRRDGQVPNPKPKPQSKKNKTCVTLQPGPERATCYDCGHFQPASSPNPTQSWGWCRHLGKGRYGVARACHAFREKGK